MNKNIFLTLCEKGEGEEHFEVDNSVGGDDYVYWVEEFEILGYNIYFVDWKDYVDSGFRRIYNFNEKKFVESRKLNSDDAIFLYKQEGFVKKDKSSFFLDMLSELEDTGAFVFNDPETIRWNFSKEHIYYLMEKGVRVCDVYEISDIISLLEAGRKFVVKPKISSRGDGLIFLRSSEDLGLLDDVEKEDYIAQEFCDGIRKGERSLFFVGCDYSHSVLKTPDPGNPEEIRCNKSTGGFVEKYEPSAEEIDYAKEVIDVIAEKYPVIFSRIDFAYHDSKPCLIEAELVNPSAFAVFAGVEKEFAEKFVGHVDKLISEHLEK
jgi:glutathione synthase/RimK-type ligase-like ATP-grasp enzyme